MKDRLKSPKESKRTLERIKRIQRGYIWEHNGWEFSRNDEWINSKIKGVWRETED